ncbi:MAG: CBS domain-containing protein [Bacteriovoracaceae bacterium]|nr:CBS domain-containing protein [Bacteriovoracaceae bacterium]
MNVSVEEYTSPILVTIDPSATLDEALDMMQENGIRHLPVVREEKVLGIVSERDLLLHVGKNWTPMMKVGDVMSTNLLSVHLNDTLGDVAYQLSSQKVGSAIVLDDDESLYGIFTTTDALNALVEIMNQQPDA